VEGRGVPLSIVVTGANRHDASQLATVLEQKVVCPHKEEQIENLCGDAAFAGTGPEEVIRSAGYRPHVRPRGEERAEKKRNPAFRARRWVVEACHSWFNRFRKLAIRYEKLASTHLALTHLAAAIITLRKIGISYHRQRRWYECAPSKGACHRAVRLFGYVSGNAC
jgi:transposase